jgi:hypothetical protein
VGWIGIYENVNRFTELEVKNLKSRRNKCGAYPERINPLLVEKESPFQNT